MASYYIKSPMGHDVNVCTCIEYHSYASLHADTCTCTDQCAVEGGSIENHSYENSTCTESCQRNTVSFTQCVYMHKSVGV